LFQRRLLLVDAVLQLLGVEVDQWRPFAHAIAHVRRQPRDAAGDFGADDGLVLGCERADGLDLAAQLDALDPGDLDRHPLAGVRLLVGLRGGLAAGRRQQQQRRDHRVQGTPVRTPVPWVLIHADSPSSRTPRWAATDEHRKPPRMNTERHGNNKPRSLSIRVYLWPGLRS